MYHSIVRNVLRKSFDQLNRGNHSAVVAQFAQDAEHWFSGTHALAGRRTGIDQITAWHERLSAVLPDLQVRITDITVTGLPHRTVAMAEWVDHFTTPAGDTWSNRGVHVIRLRWGKITAMHIHCDPTVLDAALAEIADQGRAEAAAAPIGTLDLPSGLRRA
ncbi:nuclear transport factor 2 family protein [Antribacter gilvus]|uniref:nuclear transport factor 2 family protein n=1 Tax=Antribacter gilvus TaxID=2304675 RepID=UPI000F777139|nr:nuclear transport factor 2 family protein [Antribacter gilvus]